MDFFLHLQSVPLHRKKIIEENSSIIKERVIHAREKQYERYGQRIVNNRVSIQLIQETSPLSSSQLDELQQVCWQYKWSNRTQVKIIRVARTISDLRQEHVLSNEALREAIEWKLQSVPRKEH